MKKMKMLGLLLVVVLVVAGCTSKVVNESKEMAEEKIMDEPVALNNGGKDEGAADEAVCATCGASVHESEEYCEACQLKKEDDKMMKDDEKMKGEVAHKLMNDGKTAEGFELMDLEGDLHSLEGYKGEKVYVKFWASWCPICLSGLEELDELSGMDNDFKVLTIVTPGKNGEKKAEDFKEWFEGLGYENIQVLLDEEAEITRKYGVRGYPTSAYIGSDGVLVKTLPGHNDNDSIKTTFESIH